MSVGKKLKKIRKDNRMNQEKMAEVLNTNRVRISKIENDRVDMTLNEAIIICDLFNVSLDSFLSNDLLTADDYINISERFYKNDDISEDERRNILKRIRLQFEEYCFVNSFRIGVIELQQNRDFDDICNKRDIEFESLK